jgi:hypothetical protein
LAGVRARYYLSVAIFTEQHQSALRVNIELCALKEHRAIAVFALVAEANVAQLDDVGG